MLQIPQNSELILPVDDSLNSINRAIKSLETFSGLITHPHPRALPTPVPSHLPNANTTVLPAPVVSFLSLLDSPSNLRIISLAERISCYAIALFALMANATDSVSEQEENNYDPCISRSSCATACVSELPRAKR